MSDIAVRTENLGKKYRIGGKQERYRTLRDTLSDAFVSPFRRTGKLLRGQASGAAELDETIWALKDVSFEVKPGEVVGVIGRNGAGKTTLLKILSRITEPSEGRAEIHGRVGSLLEVGTGFHPELTGRENITLNGAILGMKRAEIDKKFDEIVAFAEIEKFIDTPVKHYSSGMYVRLAFAVAAHLEPEILLVDEVLAVGDVGFQKKCLGKMGDVAEEGRTVLFVSHNMTAVQSLCERTILLAGGVIFADGESSEVVASYIGNMTRRATFLTRDRPDRSGSGRAKYYAVQFCNLDGKVIETIPMGEGFVIEAEFVSNSALAKPRFVFILYGAMHNRIASLSTYDAHGEMPSVNRGGIIRCHIHRLNLLPGTYLLSSVIFDGKELVDRVEGVATLEVAPKPIYPTGRLPKSGRDLVFVPCHWSSSYQ